MTGTQTTGETTGTGNGHAQPSWLPVQVDGIPEAMRALPRWVNWRAEQRGGKWTKVPYQANSSKKAKSNDPKTWAPLPLAMLGLRRPDRDGMGFVFCADDGISGIDLDHCLDPATGAIEPWAREILTQFEKTYAEVSPSGTGIKIFVRGTIPAGIKKGNIEIYPSGRYFAITGHRWGEHPSALADCQGALTLLYDALKNGGEHTAPPDDGGRRTSTGAASLTDDEIIGLAGRASNGGDFTRLWSGTWQGRYASQSEADLALCNLLAFYAGPQPESIDRLFRQSALFRAEKWDTKHHSNGDTYGAATIKKAIEGRTEFYAPKKSRKKKNRKLELGADSGEVPSLLYPEGRTEVANAKRLAHHHGQNLRWCDLWGKFLVWDDRRWAIDHSRGADALAKNIFQKLWNEIAALARSSEADDELKDLVRFATRTGTAYGIDAMLKLVRSESGIAIAPEALDTDPWLFNVINGTIDLRTGEQRPHRREDRITKLCPIVYDPAADCPLWCRVLADLTAGDSALQRYLQKAAGCSLTGDTREHSLFFLYGSGANGKTTFVNAILDVMGADYAMKSPPDLLLVKHNDAHPTERADLAGKRFVACMEADAGKRLAEALVKELTGGDKLRARRMREDFWEFFPTHKIWLAANHKPTIRGTDWGIWRRIKLIPFTVTIAPEKQDKGLQEKLRAELPGILNWALLGCLEWQAEGLDAPQAVAAATGEYRRQQDVLAGFLDECCVVSANVRARAGDLLAVYRKWSGDDRMSQRRLGEALTERGFGTAVIAGYTWRLGIGLNENQEPNRL